MADRFPADGGRKVAVAGRKDRISALPEDVLQQLLSWLPSRDAVRTCALARGWRNRWKTVPSLRINDDRERPETYKSAEALSNFVKMLLRFRDKETPLDVCMINTHEDGQSIEDVEPWIRYAVSRKVRTLMIDGITMRHGLLISGEALVSKHLTVLMLTRIVFSGDFLGCEALEVLEMENCTINLGSTFPVSLRHLTLRNSEFYPLDDLETRPYIYAPGLVTLEVSDCSDWTPGLDGLPSLVTAFIRIADDCDECCISYSPGELYSDSCEGCYGGDDCLLLLKALSGATNLELISRKYLIFGKELKWYPVFSKLNILSLNEWCVADNFNGLVYFLQHSPILERLSLIFWERSDTIMRLMGDLYVPRNQFLVSKHLKVVEIKCIKEDKWIHQILDVLSYHEVQPEQIIIRVVVYLKLSSLLKR